MVFHNRRPWQRGNPGDAGGAAFLVYVARFGQAAGSLFQAELEIDVRPVFPGIRPRVPLLHAAGAGSPRDPPPILRYFTPKPGKTVCVVGSLLAVKVNP